MHRLAAGHNTICGSFIILAQSPAFRLFQVTALLPLRLAFGKLFPLRSETSPRLYTSVSLGAPSRLAPAQLVVGSSGLEPPTSRLSGARSNHLSYEPIVKAAVFRPARPPCGGDEEVRTPDPLRARQVLSQLSYTPIAGVRGLTAASLFAFRFSRFLSDPQNQTTFELRTFPCH